MGIFVYRVFSYRKFNPGTSIWSGLPVITVLSLLTVDAYANS